MGTRSHIVPRPTLGRQVGAGAESAAYERAQHQASLRGDLGLSDQRLARQGRTPSARESGGRVASLIILALVAIGLIVAAIWYGRQLASMSIRPVAGHRHRLHTTVAKLPGGVVPAVAAGEADPIDAAAEWDAANPPPPEDDTGNE